MSDPGWSTRTRFVSALARAAATDGFVRDGNALIRERPETLQVLFVQVNANEPFMVTLYVGVVSRFVDAFEASRAKGKGRPSWWDRFAAGERIGQLAPKPHDAWWTLKVDADMAPVVKEIMTAVRTDVLPWFDSLATNAALAARLEAKVGGAALTERRCMLYKATGRDADFDALLASMRAPQDFARDLAAFMAR